MSELTRLHGVLQGRMSAFGLSPKSEAAVSALAEELIGSSEIEGVSLKLDSVRT